MDGFTEQELDDKSLESDFGIANKYHRSKVLRAIRDRAANDEAVTVAARGPLSGTFRTINYDELEIIRDLGSGNFGHARLARYIILSAFHPNVIQFE
jgi:hypothetical protein